MDSKLFELHKRNKLMLWLLGGSIAFGSLASLPQPSTLVTLLSSGIPILLLAAVLIWMKKLIIFIPYIITFGLNVIGFFFISVNQLYSDTIILHIVLAIIMVYHERKPLIIGGILSLFTLNYFLFTSEGFSSAEPIGANTLVIVFLGALLLSSYLSNQLTKRVEAERTQAEEARRRSEQIIAELKDSIDILNQSTESLQGNAETTGVISKEIVVAFQEIASGIESQSFSVQQNLTAMQEVSDTVSQTYSASIEMSDKSKDTVEITERGHENMKQMSDQVQKVNHYVSSTTSLIEEVNEDSSKISDIVALIGEIANQTNLLSLNASIEAARAGEHGQGFAVVATEIRKLAMNVQEASQQVSDRILGIQGKIEQVTRMASGSMQATEESGLYVNSVVQLFDRIKANTDEVLQQSNHLRTINKQLSSSASKVTTAMEDIASITEQSAASVEEVLASTEVQQGRVNEMIDNISKLTQLANKLENVVNNQ